MKRHPCLLESLKRSEKASKTLLLALNKDLDYYKMIIGTKFYAPQILEGVHPNPTTPLAYGPGSDCTIVIIHNPRWLPNIVTILDRFHCNCNTLQCSLMLTCFESASSLTHLESTHKEKG